jgi:hypothetical protein
MSISLVIMSTASLASFLYQITKTGRDIDSLQGLFRNTKTLLELVKELRNSRHHSHSHIASPSRPLSLNQEAALYASSRWMAGGIGGVEQMLRSMSDAFRWNPEHEDRSPAKRIAWMVRNKDVKTLEHRLNWCYISLLLMLNVLMSMPAIQDLGQLAAPIRSWSQGSISILPYSSSKEKSLERLLTLHLFYPFR